MSSPHPGKLKLPGIFEVADHSNIRGFLADTWWFGLSKRLSEQGFRDLATLRAAQGFSAVQLVVGVPPEVGPENENARSQVGFPWTLDGDFNQEYLEFARLRIQVLNKLGFVVLVYGAWGHQIEWLGQEKMAQWWLKIIETLDALNVIYCLCGESNLWIGEEDRLLPARSTDDLVAHQTVLSLLRASVRKPWAEAARRFKRWLHRHQYERRRSSWSLVLEKISQKTNRPIIVHPTADQTGYEAVSNPELLSANTVQTGHDACARNRLWRLPLALLKDDQTHRGYINLEPWYEGIGEQFWAEDQLFAYWVTMLAGATSYCYGAHGIWNVGDGQFLAHWGKQTFAQAMALDTPGLLGLSHQQYLMRSDPQDEVFYQTEGEELTAIGRKAGAKIIQFFPDVARADPVPAGRIWLPLEGVFVERLPRQGQVVIFRD
jgi:hypothetical protein